MKKEEIMQFNKIVEVVKETLNLSSDVVLTEDTSLRNDLNADSVDAVEIIIALEEEFGLEISEEEANTVDTIGDLDDYISKIINE